MFKIRKQYFSDLISLKTSILRNHTANIANFEMEQMAGRNQIIVQLMGACAYKTQDLPFSKKAQSSMCHLLSPQELTLLHYIYRDLAARTIERALSKEGFSLFFQKNGLWGQQLFRQFATDESGLLEEESFIRGIARIAKSSEIQKIGLLFKCFSRGKQEGISFKEFLTMLYNYPKEELRAILTDRQFIEAELRQRMVLLQQGYRDGMEHNTYILRDSQSIIRKSDTRISIKDLPSLIGREITKELYSNRPIEHVLSYTNGKELCQIRGSNVQQLVKQFAKRIFKEAGVDIRSGNLTFYQFACWVKAHPAIYQNYYDGFHQQVWENDPKTRKPRYLVGAALKHSEATMQMGNGIAKVQLFLHGSLLVVTQRQRADKPIQVLCLEGLAVKRYHSLKDPFGIQISHRDGIYPQKRIYFSNQATQQSWMSLLQLYRGQTVQQKYEIGSKIGTGKFSVVYKCRQRTQDSLYALKEIATFKLNPQQHAAIAHQGSIMQMLSHPLLLKFKQSFQTPSHIYIVTQLVEGCDLFDFVSQQQFLQEYDAAKITQQLIVGLRYLHSFDIVHRDIKPENIMVVLDEQGQVSSIKIIDFGFSDHLSKLTKLPPEKRLVGTPNYIAPEVLREQDIGYQVDTFSVGVVLFFMLTGYLPFDDCTLPAILQNTIRGQFAFPGFPKLSEQSMDLISQMIHNDPQKRISLKEAIRHPWFNVLKQPHKTFKSRSKLDLL